MKVLKFAVVAAAVVAMSAGAANAQWAEVGDAGSFPAVSGAQATGAGLLTTITGATSGAAGDTEDAYLIRVDNPALFHATTDSLQDPAAATSFDTRLWMFDLAGNAVLANDDSPTNTAFQSLVMDSASFPGTIGLNAPLPLVAGGQYVLVISGFSNDPQDIANNDMVSLGAFTALNGPNPLAGAFDHWQPQFAASGTYTIALTGASAVPEPATLGMMLIGGIALIRRRR